MRNLILGIGLAAGLATVSLTSPQEDKMRQAGVIAIDKVAVRPEDLPEAIKSTLSGEYADWKVSNAYLVTRENNSQYYEISLKKGEESTSLNLDKYGKKVD